MRSNVWTRTVDKSLVEVWRSDGLSDDQIVQRLRERHRKLEAYNPPPGVSAIMAALMFGEHHQP